ncbi:glycoside hydrolase family 18 protein [Metarhizium robertsii ARSEF 23]|uniref:chitinase n=1 Tax=Metarhizium robertsii (strain ARSEF 23 / ATCC MYA-3075) TaxID=655844 RepID=E9FE10_METRA|nr:glycoside hydrolase family 18 protein [Metarhizium robertsii ARSEF 23]EFY94032.1 glycoside hydrolase family 18 protein [Metarhizium robertsii ARSEF 23]
MANREFKCRAGCQSTCERQADCNPGWDGSQWSKQDKCPLNVCCSRHGFCGFTEEFCDGKEVQRPSCSPKDKPVSRVIGYFESWATSERSCFTMSPEEIPYGLYTHIIFSFATIHPQTFEVSPGNSQTEYIMSRIGAIKLVQPDVKVWVAIGGWAFNDPGPTATTFSDLAASEAHMERFFTSLIKMMNTYGFDGIDIDWEYPVAPDRNGRDEDYKNIVSFMRELRHRMDQHKKGVSMAIPASYWYLQHFDIAALEAAVDWFNLMSYDMHGAWDIDNRWTGPWANAHTNITEIQLALDLLWRNNINPNKVTMGMSFYSRSFTLTKPSCNKPGCRVSSAGNPGRCSGTTGVLLHAEIRDIIKKEGLKPVLHRDAAVKTVSWGNQWASFDDLVTWRLKANRFRSQCISGFMVWAMSQDDQSYTNAQALNSALERPTMDLPDFNQKDVPADAVVESPPKLCRWTSCFEGCPSGFKEIQRDGHKEIMMDTTQCPGGTGHGFIRFCCPADQELPVCTWRGHKNSGNCSPGCKTGEVEVGTVGSGCKNNHQSACCSEGKGTAAYGKCSWTGCSKNPQEACRGFYPYFVVASSVASGGAKSCGKSQKRSYCCAEPPPAEFSDKCDWHKKAGFLTDKQYAYVCEGACPSGQIRLSVESGLTVDGDGCYGNVAFCCPEPAPPTTKPSRRDDFGSTQAKEFELLMQKYMENPTCPAAILQPNLHDMFNGGMPAKRSIEMEAREYDILRGRAINCAMDNWIRLLSYATLMFTMNKKALDPFRKVWDSEFAASYDTALEYSALEGFFRDYPIFDTRGVIEYILYNPLVAGAGVRRARNAREVFCERSSSRRSLERRDDQGPLWARRVWAWGGGTNDVPGLETILEGIRVGHLTLHYARWQYQEGQATASAPGPILELAYWIGPQPGVHTEDAELDQYRDTTARNAPDDRWVVFHLHVDPTREWLRRINGHTYLGVDYLSVYHGQEVRGARGRYAWRVQNIDSGYLNARDGFSCDSVGDGLWYVGSPRAVEGQEPWYQLVQEWSEVIYNQGYVRSPGIRLILEGGNPPSGEIDPQDPGVLALPNTQTNAASGADPYTINWLITQGDRYDFFPPAPPSS